jgi:type VI secretion system protein ImpF
VPQSPSKGSITPSLFDRLTDNAPGFKHDLPSTPWQQKEEMKRSVAVDLTSLLNVRRNDLEIPEEFDQTNRSIAAYGLRDLSTCPMDPDQIRRAIEKCVRTFEPRLSNVSVRFLSSVSFRLEFQILATLRIDTQREQILFDAVVPTHSRRFQVSESR